MSFRTFFSKIAHELVLAIFLAAILVFAWSRDPSFIDLQTQLQLAPNAAQLLLLALPMTLVIISGGIDLSIGSTLALAAVVLGLTAELLGASGADLRTTGLGPIVVPCVAALLTGAAAGALNGFFVAKLRVHPLIVTLASLAAYRGLAEGISLARPISGFPDAFQWLGSGELWGVPVPLLVCIAALLVAFVFAACTTAGFRLYAIGGSEPAARYAAIPVDRSRILLYISLGVVAALAAILLVARRNTAKADMGAGIELEVITAVVLGGTSIHGGRGRIIGTLLGVAIIHQIREFLSWHYGRDEIISVVIGSILILSVLFTSLASACRTRVQRLRGAITRRTVSAPRSTS